MQSAKPPHRILLKGKDQTNDVLSYCFIGNKCTVTFKNGNTYSYNADNVKIIKATAAENKKLAYFKELASIIGITVELDNGDHLNILERAYSSIHSVSCDSIAKCFLSGDFNSRSATTSCADKKQYNSTDTVIYPFAFNISQKQAVDNALTDKLSLIEGPPGTGKTQTILNIIANAVMRNESVAVVSSNNSATKNVFDKLKSSGFGFIAAYLGNKENKSEFINSQTSLPDMSNWQLTDAERIDLHQKLYHSYKELHEKLKLQIRLAELNGILSATQTEQKHFLKFCQQLDIQQNIHLGDLDAKSQTMLQLALLCETSADYTPKNPFVRFFLLCLDSLRFWDSPKRLLRSLKKNYSLETLFILFQKKFYEAKIAELDTAIRTIRDQLASFDFSKKMSEYSDLSNTLFKASLAGKYLQKQRKYYSEESLHQESKNFLNDYPVVLSTTYSLRNCLSQNVLYDYIIIDEASQVDLCTGFLALNCARKAVIVGDLKQLPKVVDSTTCNSTDILFKKYNIEECYNYSRQSILSSASMLFPKASRTLLREHYRCHPQIIEFCNKKFYNNQLIVMTEAHSQREPLRLYKTVAGNHARDRKNQRQIDMIRNEIIPENHICITDNSLGIVTPYRNQSNALAQAFKATGVKADTVDKFQGQENRIIILSTVDNKVTDFTDNPNRLNVAVSRAIDQLIVIVNEGDALKDKNIGDLVRYIQYNNFSVMTSKVYSVFDYLYKEYAELRKEHLKAKKKISQYDSENLLYTLLCDILRKERDLESYEIAHHVPLKMLLRDVSIMNEEEKRYALNRLTHVDFLLFNTFDKSPKLAIEVDGVAFHKEGTRQAERDAMKDAILKKYGLPLLRLRTDGSGERQQILSKLREHVMA